MSGGVTASGDYAALASELRATGAALRDLAEPGRDAATLVLDAVEIPYRTGALASTADAVVTTDGVTFTAGGPRAPYGPLVHQRDPFFTRALDQRADQVVDAYAAHIARALTIGD